jgi:hypothetical protein
VIAAIGRERQMVVLALARMKNPKAIEVLIALLDDNGHGEPAPFRQRLFEPLTEGAELR